MCVNESRIGTLVLYYLLMAFNCHGYNHTSHCSENLISLNE